MTPERTIQRHAAAAVDAGAVVSIGADQTAGRPAIRYAAAVDALTGEGGPVSSASTAELSARNAEWGAARREDLRARNDREIAQRAAEVDAAAFEAGAIAELPDHRAAFEAANAAIAAADLRRRRADRVGALEAYRQGQTPEPAAAWLAGRAGASRPIDSEPPEVETEPEAEPMKPSEPTRPSTSAAPKLARVCACGRPSTSAECAARCVQCGAPLAAVPWSDPWSAKPAERVA